MKRGIAILLVSFICFAAQAQKLNINSAINAIKSNDFTKAKKYIDLATKNESTKKSGKAWLVKAFVYQAIGTDPMKNPQTGQNVPFIANIAGKAYVMDLNKAKSMRPTTPDALMVAAKSFNRYLYFQKRPEESVVAIAVSSIAVKAYNTGIAKYKDNQYDEAIKSFNQVEYVANLKKGAFFKNLPSEYAPLVKQMNDLSSNSLKYKAYTAYYKNDDKFSLPILEECIATSKGVDDNIYLMAARIYKKQDNNDKYMSTIRAGLKKFKDSKALQNEELNFFITGNDPDAAAKKLEEAIASDPSSAEYRFNAGVMYDKLAVAAKDKVKSDEYFSKSESAYKKAIELAPKNTDYQFNLGALYFNKAKAIIDVMNKELDTKKYEAMKKGRDAQMALALPALEGVKTTLEAKGLGDERDKQTYKSSLTALKSVYAILGKLDKAKAVSTLLQKLQ